ncbi:ARM REPEAT SUPERFAMILY PROTEIN [Salix koriyanagi]|uniref:ARM REPEAT SUPERFAMILY PROTEIN n=1 Tax=Salix koriyanagi TaxID=2511006 RepID=A0A9Q0ZUY3_9ROSI|nr:ARM REPEAT SUPERFAMILY PROTEIN [Salix koriyanagi]KAJ6747492.1 ARM REPEAT SUPERFAMILY PROTEIN [Salix koriyanagi]
MKHRKPETRIRNPIEKRHRNLPTATLPILRLYSPTAQPPLGNCRRTPFHPYSRITTLNSLILLRRCNQQSLRLENSRFHGSCGVTFARFDRGFCDLEEWDSVKAGFESLIKFSIDKRPKVRRSAQECLEKVFKSFRSSTVVKEASKLVFSLFKNYMPVALTLSESRIFDESKEETLSKLEHLDVIHMLNLLKVTVPYISVKISSKVLPELVKLLRSEFSVLTRQVFQNIEAFLVSSSDEVIGPQEENIIDSLSGYLSLGQKNPVDTVLYATTLLRITLDKLRARGSSSWMSIRHKVCGSAAGLLADEATASQASDIMKELINLYIDPKEIVINESQSLDDASQESEEANMVKSTCAVLENILNSCVGIPNEHLLGVISVLFNKLGDISHLFMKNIILKLADLMDDIGHDKPDTNHLRNCMGSAVVAIGPEKMLMLLPISINPENFTCSNIWLVPILKDHVVGASLGYYMEHIVPLAKSFKQAGRKVKKSVIGQDLQAHAHGLWGLLPAFCRYPVDTQNKFGTLTELMITSLKKYSFMHQNIAVALQVLVNQNRSVMYSKSDGSVSNGNTVKDSVSECQNVAPYSKKTATKNIKALASCSSELLHALVDIFIDSQSGKPSYIKDAIACLASISNSSVTQKVFMSLLERFQFVTGEGEFQQPKNYGDELVEEEVHSLNVQGKDVHRCVMMELASSLVVGAKADLIDLIYNFVVFIFQATDVTGHCEAYHTLSRILQEHSWFCSSRFVELTDLLLGQKSPADVATLKNRFACFHILIVHALEMNSEEENTKAFLMLNEIILILKDAREEARKVAYDTLLFISSSLRNSSCTTSGEAYQRLISMLTGYLSGSSPYITSGAVSALSVLVHNDAEICLKVPDLVPSLLSLLQNKALEVIKAVLGFTKVLVSCLKAKDLQNFLSDIISGVLPWSSVSRNHIRSKVTVILEIMIRKCGFSAVESDIPEKHKSFFKTVLQVCFFSKNIAFSMWFYFSFSKHFD